MENAYANAVEHLTTGFTQDYLFINVSVLEGEEEIDGSKIAAGDHIIIPYGYGEVGLSGAMNLILSTVEQ